MARYARVSARKESSRVPSQSKITARAEMRCSFTGEDYRKDRRNSNETR